jgi:hypothetical protein
VAKSKVRDILVVFNRTRFGCLVRDVYFVITQDSTAEKYTILFFVVSKFRAVVFKYDLNTDFPVFTSHIIITARIVEELAINKTSLQCGCRHVYTEYIDHTHTHTHTHTNYINIFTDLHKVHP